MGLERRVVLAGWGQATQPKIIDGTARDPLGLMVQAALSAAGISSTPSLLTGLDAIMVVRTVSHHYEDPGQQLARKLNANPKKMMLSGIGGNSPQTLINIAAGMIARGEIDSVLVAGAECYVQRGTDSQQVENALFRGVPRGYNGDDLNGAADIEKKHGMEHPMQGFPLYETALWADSGLDLNSYLKKVGTMWASFSRVAATHPYAWTKIRKSAEQIITPAPDNRMVAFPYTKFMNSFVTVDQGAAIILTTEEKAGSVMPKNLKPVYFLGGAYAKDRQRFMIEKSDFTACPPLKTVVEHTLQRAEMSLEEIECFDLYSCFPSAVAIAKKMIGIGDSDPRPLTLTGGLGFFGGPGNNYSLHSTATLADHIAKGKVNRGMITAMGWFLHKHAAGIYSNRPSQGLIGNYDLEDHDNGPIGDPPEKFSDQVDDTGVVETYTVIFSKNARPAYALVYGRTSNGIRFVARTPSDDRIYHQMMSQNKVGQAVQVTYDARKKFNIARFL